MFYYKPKKHEFGLNYMHLNKKYCLHNKNLLKQWFFYLLRFKMLFRIPISVSLGLQTSQKKNSLFKILVVWMQQFLAIVLMLSVLLVENYNFTYCLQKNLNIVRVSKIVKLMINQLNKQCFVVRVIINRFKPPLRKHFLRYILTGCKNKLTLYLLSLEKNHVIAALWNPTIQSPIDSRLRLAG